MKKKLSADALDILAVAAISGWSMCSDELQSVAELVHRGYIMADRGPGVTLRPTTAGVRHLISAKVIVQNGTKFALAEGFEARRQGGPLPTFSAPLRVVEPRAPDPFKDGMDAAIAGLPCPDMTNADCIAGFDAGLTVKRQGIV